LEWKVFSNCIDGKANYIAGRRKSMQEPLHGGNIEYSGGYCEDRETVEGIVAELNDKGKFKF